MVDNDSEMNMNMEMNDDNMDNNVMDNDALIPLEVEQGLVNDNDSVNTEIRCESGSSVSLIQNGSIIDTNESDNDLIYCDVCNKSMRSQSRLNDHKMRLHSGYNAYKCNDHGCQKQFRTRKALLYHKLNKTLDKLEEQKIDNDFNTTNNNRMKRRYFEPLKPIIDSILKCDPNDIRCNYLSLDCYWAMELRYNKTYNKNTEVLSTLINKYEFMDELYELPRIKYDLASLYRNKIELTKDNSLRDCHNKFSDLVEHYIFQKYLEGAQISTAKEFMKVNIGYKDQACIEQYCNIALSCFELCGLFNQYLKQNDDIQSNVIIVYYALKGINIIKKYDMIYENVLDKKEFVYDDLMIALLYNLNTWKEKKNILNFNQINRFKDHVEMMKLYDKLNNGVIHEIGNMKKKYWRILKKRYNDAETLFDEDQWNEYKNDLKM